MGENTGDDPVYSRKGGCMRGKPPVHRIYVHILSLKLWTRLPKAI